MLHRSEMDPHAAKLARGRADLGWSWLKYCVPERPEDEPGIVRRALELRNIAAISLHAPRVELFPCANDTLALVCGLGVGLVKFSVLECLGDEPCIVRRE